MSNNYNSNSYDAVLSRMESKIDTLLVNVATIKEDIKSAKTDIHVLDTELKVLNVNIKSTNIKVNENTKNIENVKNRVTSLEHFKYYLMAIIAAFSFLGSYIMDKIKG